MEDMDGSNEVHISKGAVIDHFGSSNKIKENVFLYWLNILASKYVIIHHRSMQK